jgi:hypothetical protein
MSKKCNIVEPFTPLDDDYQKKNPVYKRITAVDLETMVVQYSMLRDQHLQIKAKMDSLKPMIKEHMCLQPMDEDGSRRILIGGKQVCLKQRYATKLNAEAAERLFTERDMLGKVAHRILSVRLPVRLASKIAQKLQAILQPLGIKYEIASELVFEEHIIEQMYNEGKLSDSDIFDIMTRIPFKGVALLVDEGEDDDS